MAFGILVVVACSIDMLREDAARRACAEKEKQGGVR